MWAIRDTIGVLWIYTHKPILDGNGFWELPDGIPLVEHPRLTDLTGFSDLLDSVSREKGPVEVEFIKDNKYTMKKLWVARDKDGSLYMYDGYPVRDVDVWDVSGPQPADSAEIFAELFPELTWDDEPIEVNLIRAPKIIKKKHGDDK